MNGLLIVDKPIGLTSFDVVARVRRVSHERRIGHAGTLDPLATGVLPLALGRATRVIEYLSEAGKEYKAGIAFGATSETYDREGPITPVDGAAPPSREQVEAALEQFSGPITQLPPMHSAVKHQGKRLYELARAGIEVERKPRNVTIYRIELLDYTPPVATIRVACSKGTYIRSIAHDLGAALGCGAYLDSLVRTHHGPFDIGQAATMEQVAQIAEDGQLAATLLPFDSALGHLPRFDFDADEARMLIHGREVEGDAALDEGTIARIYSPDGEFLALARWIAERQLWKPEKVFVDNESNN